MIANVKSARYDVAVCNEDKENPVIFKGKRGENEVPIEDHCTYLVVATDLGTHI